MIKWFIKTFPSYYKMMNECSYHYKDREFNNHHLEGNVWTFTMLSFNQGIINNVPLHIQYALLLQDIGRVLTRKENHKSEHISFGDFEGASCVLGVEVLNQTSLSNQEKIRILKIISYQYTMTDFLHSSEPNFDELLATFKYEEELLKDLAVFIKCNFSGRVVEESKKDQYNTQKVDILIESLQELEITKKIVEEKTATLNILVGLPCSLKSSWVEKQEGDFILVNRDDFTLLVGAKHKKFTYDDADKYLLANDKLEDEADRLYEEHKDMTKNSMGKNIIIDNPNLKIKKRKNWINAMSKTHNINIVLFLRAYTSLIECDKLRSKKIKKTIGKKLITKQLKEFYFPLFSEGFDTIESIFVDSTLELDINKTNQ
ncbi:MAG: AAA family ATPase [Helicobacteraceae bacterium]|nr:AAA family ATPase [Helicobacteraceae bacterium]